MSAKRNLNEASKEELVAIVKQLHMKLQQSQQSVSASSAGALTQAQLQLREHDERIQSLTEQSKLLKNELKAVQQEKQTLMKEVSSLREKSKADEDTIKELIRQIEEFPSTQIPPPVANTTPVALTPPPQPQQPSTPTPSSQPLKATVSIAHSQQSVTAGSQGSGESALLQLAESLKLRVRELEGDLMTAHELLREADETRRFLESACRAQQSETNLTAAVVAEPEDTRRVHGGAAGPSSSTDDGEEVRALRRRVRQLRADCEGQGRIAEAHRQEVQRLLYAQAAHVLSARDSAAAAAMLSAQSSQHILDELTGVPHDTAESTTAAAVAMPHAGDLSPPRPNRPAQAMSVLTSSRFSEGTGESASHRQSATLFHSQPSVSSSTDDVHVNAAAVSSAPPPSGDFVSSLPAIQLRGATPREKKLLERIKLLEEHIHAHSVMDATKRRQWDAMEQTRTEMVTAFQDQIGALRAELVSAKQAAKRISTSTSAAAEAPSLHDVGEGAQAPTHVRDAVEQVIEVQSVANPSTLAEATTMTEAVVFSPPTEIEVAAVTRLRELEEQVLHLTTEKQEREGRVRAALGSVQTLKSTAEDSDRRARAAELALRGAVHEGERHHLLVLSAEERLSVLEECWLATSDMVVAALRSAMHSEMTRATAVVRPELGVATGDVRALDDAAESAIHDAEWLVRRLSSLTQEQRSPSALRVAEPAVDLVAPLSSTVLTPKWRDEKPDGAALSSSYDEQNLFDFFSVPQTVHETPAPSKVLPQARSTVVEFDPFA